MTWFCTNSYKVEDLFLILYFPMLTQKVKMYIWRKIISVIAPREITVFLTNNYIINIEIFSYSKIHCGYEICVHMVPGCH